MNDLRKEALQALEDGEIYDHFGARWGEKRIEALRAALAQPEQEPVAAAEREACIALLKGIDQTESESDDGWWETSTGAKFGAGVLAAIRARGAATRQTLISDFHSACAGIGLSPNEVERIRCSLAQPEPEPVAWCNSDDLLEEPRHVVVTGKSDGWRKTPLFTAPPQRKPLTDQEIIEAIKHISHNEMSAFAIARVIENVLKNAPSEANKGTYDNP